MGGGGAAPTDAAGGAVVSVGGGGRRWAMRCRRIGLVPDFVPVLGQLDDVLIVPGLVALGRWLVPREVVAAWRAAAAERTPVGWMRG